MLQMRLKKKIKSFLVLKTIEALLLLFFLSLLQPPPEGVNIPVDRICSLKVALANVCNPSAYITVFYLNFLVAGV